MISTGPSSLGVQCQWANNTDSKLRPDRVAVPSKSIVFNYLIFSIAEKCGLGLARQETDIVKYNAPQCENKPTRMKPHYY